MAGGMTPGKGSLSALKSLPQLGKAQFKRAVNKLVRTLGPRPSDPCHPYAQAIVTGIGRLDYLLSPEMLDRILHGGLEAIPVEARSRQAVLNRMLTLIEAHAYLDR